MQYIKQYLQFKFYVKILARNAVKFNTNGHVKYL